MLKWCLKGRGTRSGSRAQLLDLLYPQLLRRRCVLRVDKERHLVTKAVSHQARRPLALKLLLTLLKLMLLQLLLRKALLVWESLLQ